MGRAIDMEKDIDMLKIEVEKLNNIIRGMSSSLSELEDKSTKTKHVDLVEDVKVEEGKKDGKKKPTLKEIEKVVNLVIQQMEIQIGRINRLEYITEVYHEYKNEKDQFIKYLNEKIEEDDKNRNSDSLRDDQERDI